jgi:hypothetical protein
MTTATAFRYAVAIARMSRTGGGSIVDFIMQHAALETEAPTCPRSIADLEARQRDVWDRWPETPDGVTFGPVGGDSALRIVARFVDIILNATDRPEGCDALEAFPFPDPRVQRWHDRACAAVCKAIPDNWNELTIKADANALLVRIRNEWTKAEGIKHNADAAEPLSDQERAVLEVIQAQPLGVGIIGKKIIAELEHRQGGLDIDQAALTSRIIPRLKKHYGVQNRRNVGYYIPST